MSSDSRVGWAIRREGLCNANEGGRATWDDWSKCCPAGLEIHLDDENNPACIFPDDVPDKIPTQCANSTWFLWEDNHGYFCCDPDQRGFVNNYAWKGCSTLEEINSNSTWKEATKLAQVPVSTTSAESTGSSGSSGSNTNKGAIAGGVVGGVCGALLIVGIIWFFLRRRRRLSEASKPEGTFATPEPKPYTTPRDNGNMPVEVYGHSTLEELPDSSQSCNELPGNSPAKAHEQSYSELLNDRYP